MSTKLTQPIKWHGGKHYLARWIIGQMPPHLHYVEPFFGGGAVLLARDPLQNWMSTDDSKLPSYQQGCSEVVNDLNCELTNFWQVLRDRDNFGRFRRLVEFTPFSKVDWSQAGKEADTSDRVERAYRFFIRARLSRQGLSKDFATLSRNRTRRGMNEQVSSYSSAIDGLEDVHCRLQQVVILNSDACSVIKQQDGRHTLFYCDPPYLHETRVSASAYEHEMSYMDHEKLLHTLSGIKGKFMLSGYGSDLYDTYARKHRWRREEKLIDNKASSAKVKERKCECLWTNFSISQ